MQSNHFNPLTSPCDFFNRVLSGLWPVSLLLWGLGGSFSPPLPLALRLRSFESLALRERLGRNCYVRKPSRRDFVYGRLKRCGAVGERGTRAGGTAFSEVIYAIRMAFKAFACAISRLKISNLQFPISNFQSPISTLQSPPFSPFKRGAGGVGASSSASSRPRTTTPSAWYVCRLLLLPP